MVIGFLTLIGIVVAFFMYERKEPDPLEMHVAAIERVAYELVQQAAAPEWTNVKMLYATPDINEDLNMGWALVAYRYTDQGAENSVQFAAKFVPSEEWSQTGKAQAVWKVQAIGVRDPAKMKQAETYGGTMPTYMNPNYQQAQQPKVETPKTGLEEDDDWQVYRWIPFELEKVLPILRGQPFELKPEPKTPAGK